ncbi:hypothetical protein OHC33_009865 [Knufia fluminis]|uniref:Nudix hydrolase domain-containing protein n=1 Tax=Knufia fluminis TaxID=191047 RepID=A0AAN8E8P7_9EURO|nr:hypothetical protein OHC33_009865 [Knufia fluminis]
MAGSNNQAHLYSQTDFVESAGCILFDFRSTGIDSRSTTQTGAQSHDETTTTTAPTPDLYPTKIILIHKQTKRSPYHKYLLPKGRRNIGESRAAAALREIAEETGLKCELLPVTLRSRATADDNRRGGYTLDEVRVFRGCTDPFMMTMRRQVGDDRREVWKVVWWFVGVVCETQVEEGEGYLDEGCEAVGVGREEAVGRCTRGSDGEVVRRAIEVVRGGLGG